MEHVVFFTGPDRAPQFRRTPSLDEAVRFVESLRNGEGIDDSKVYSLTEIPLRFQTYYRVEVPTDAAAGAPAPAAPPAAAAAPEAVTPPAAPTLAAPEAAEPPRAPDVAPAPAPEPIVEVVPPPATEQVFEPIAVATDNADASGGADAGSADGDAADATTNGKPNRGLGFFAR